MCALISGQPPPPDSFACDGLRPTRTVKFRSPAVTEAVPLFAEISCRHGKTATLSAVLALTVEYAVRWNLALPVAMALRANADILENTVRSEPHYTSSCGTLPKPRMRFRKRTSRLSLQHPI